MLEFSSTRDETSRSKRRLAGVLIVVSEGLRHARLSADREANWEMGNHQPHLI